MNFHDALELARWAAPKAWPDDLVVQVTRLLRKGTSPRRIARTLRMAHDSVARVRRVLQAAGGCPKRSVLRFRLLVFW
jgi:transposase-like protein